MKYCPKCHSKNPDVSKFCGSCGADISNVMLLPDDWEEKRAEYERAMAETPTAPASDTPTPTPAVAPTATATAVTSYVDADVQDKARKIFSIPSAETVVGSVGNSFFGSMLAGGGVKESLAVVTDKRLYYHGRSFNKEKRKVSSVVEDGSVRLQDISFTGTQESRSKTIFIVAGIFIAIEILLLVLGGISGDPSSAMSIASSVFGVYLVPILGGMGIYYALIGRKKNSTLFVVNFPGGGIMFDLKWYPATEIAAFRAVLTEMINKAKGA